MAKNRFVSWLVAASLVVVVLVAVVAFVARKRASERLAVRSELSARLSARSSTPWTRPVLRGETIPGNAADAQHEVVKRLGRPEAIDNDALRTALREGLPLPGPAVEFVGTQAAELAALRASTRRGESWTAVDIGAGLAARYPEFAPNVTAARAVLVEGIGAGPDACLSSSADVVRLGQDLAAGTGLLGRMVSMAMTTVATGVGARCATSASASARAQAKVEFAALRAAEVSLGPVFADEMLALVAALAELLEARPLVPMSGQELGTLFTSRRIRPLMTAALEEEARIRASTATGKELLAELRATAARLAAIGPVTAGALEFEPDIYAKYVDRAVSVETRYRAMLLGLEALEILNESGSLPPTPPVLAGVPATEAATESPLVWTVTDGSLTVGSYGADGVRDPATNGDDVLLTFAPPAWFGAAPVEAVAQ